MMNYIKPADVLSPKGSLEIIRIIKDGGEDSFSLAEIRWEGELGIGIRWNVSSGEWYDDDKIKGLKECIGTPSSRGYSTWFVLPKEFHHFVKITF